jgi:hypothetical protein
MATRERKISSISAMPLLPAVSATLMPGLMAPAISSRSNCSRSAASISSTRGLGNFCLTLTTFGNATIGSSRSLTRNILYNPEKNWVIRPLANSGFS